MADITTGRRESVRRTRELALALCTAWLVVQNSLVLALLLGSSFARMRGALAIARALLTALAPVWVVAALALVGGVTAAMLAARSQRQEWEAEHGHAR
jgi:hypothetical protein